jgi:hypothetical protein
MARTPKLKPILGFWIYAEGRKPFFIIDQNHEAALNYHLTTKEVAALKPLLDVCIEERTSKTFLKQNVSVEIVFDHCLTPPIAITKSVVEITERSWQFFDARIGYDNQLTEEGSEKRVDIYDFCHTQGEARRLLKTSEPMFEVHREVSGTHLGRHEEESE